MKLQIDPKSETWRAIESWADERLNQLRLKNDSMSSEVDTAFMRGKIAGFKELLALTKAPAIEADDSGPTY